MSGHFNITLTREEYIKAFWLYLRRRWLWRRLTVTFLAIWLAYSALIVGLGLYDWGFDPDYLPSQLATGLMYSVFVALALVLISLVTVPRRVGRLFDQLGIAGRTTRFEFDADGLKCSNPEASANYAWTRFMARSEDQHFFLLLLAEAAFIVIPKQQLSPAAHDAFGAALAKTAIPLR